MNKVLGTFYCNKESKLAFLAIKKSACTSITTSLAILKTDNIKNL